MLSSAFGETLLYEASCVVGLEIFDGMCFELRMQLAKC